MKMFRLFLSLSISMSLLSVSCKDESEQMDVKQKCSVKTVEGDTSSVIGEWKLITEELILSPTGPPNIDFSCNNVIYTFSQDGMVSVSNDADTRISYASGKYPYEFKGNSVSGNRSTLIIDGRAWPCQVFANTMILDDSPLDGGKLTFYRTKI